MDISIVVAAYNEAPTLEPTVKEIVDVLTSLNCSYEVLIVDDGSNDGTELVADKLETEIAGVRVIHHTSNQGLGGFYRTTFRESRGDYVSCYPADGQFPASIIADMLPLMGSHDMVLGFIPNRNCSLQARILSWAERVLYRILFGKVPLFQGILMFKRELLTDMPLQSKGRGWAILWEFILRAIGNGCRTTNVATKIRPRTYGSSKVHTRGVIWSNLVQVFSLYRIMQKKNKLPQRP